jgi:hypothetical protein
MHQPYFVYSLNDSRETVFECCEKVNGRQNYERAPHEAHTTTRPCCAPFVGRCRDGPTSRGLYRSR